MEEKKRRRQSEKRNEAKGERKGGGRETEVDHEQLGKKWKVIPKLQNLLEKPE